jgi:hypothetical protein
VDDGGDLHCGLNDLAGDDGDDGVAGVAGVAGGAGGAGGDIGATGATGAGHNRRMDGVIGVDEEDCSSKLDAIEDEIDRQTQQETAEYRLRSATRWTEQGERSNKYFFRVIKQRTAQQTIQSLKDSHSGTILTKSADIIREVREFYQKLYTPDEIDEQAIDTVLDSIPSDVKITPTQADMVIADVNYDIVYDLLQHAPVGRSPGLDGISFEIYKYLFQSCAAFSKLLVQVMQDALLGIFPPSWRKTRMVLLFKKGDPELLKNWRPLSLIDSDAKLVTKLLANRFNKVLHLLINPYQTGFMPNRLTSDNGWLNQTLMAHIQEKDLLAPCVAVLLDQEKAYDLVHPEYLRHLLIRFGFPDTLVTGLSSLFFWNENFCLDQWLVKCTCRPIARAPSRRSFITFTL